MGIVVLDASPLGLVSSPKASGANEECRHWLRSLLAQSVRVILPEIADYEVRRELLRSGRTAGVRRLDQLKRSLIYQPLTTETMLLAATFWADVRRRGRPTADVSALDGDVILAAQASIASRAGDQVVVATSNMSHLSLFVSAEEWRSISTS